LSWREYTGLLSVAQDGPNTVQAFASPRQFTEFKFSDNELLILVSPDKRDNERANHEKIVADKDGIADTIPDCDRQHINTVNQYQDDG
jgi:hypothetical protein